MVEKFVTGLWLVAYIAIGVIYDIQMFETGAVATISQVWLSVNKRFWAVTFVSAFLFGVLQRHVSVPIVGLSRLQTYSPPAEFYLHLTQFLFIAAIGYYVGYLYLSQYGAVD